MRYYFIVGEPSGDLHASKVMAQIQKEDSGATFRYWGGDMMCEVAGKEGLVKHLKESSYMGFIDVIKNLPTILGQITLCKKDILEFRPDVIVLVDYAGFNLRIAKFAKKHGIKVYYYIAPKVWAWKEHRVKALKRYVDELFVIFPFEVDYFKGKGIESHYFGNPIVDEVARKGDYSPSLEQFCEQNGLDVQKPIVALLSGSRRGEIRDNLPYMIKVASNFLQYQFVIAGVEWLDDSLYQKYGSDSAENVKLVKNQTYNLLKVAKGAIVTSGTATLETALLKTPEIVCYHTPAFITFIARILIKIKFVSLVNIILGRAAIKELLGGEMNVENGCKELKAVMAGGEKHQKVMEDYALLSSLMGEGEVSVKVGSKMVELLKK